MNLKTKRPIQSLKLKSNKHNIIIVIDDVSLWQSRTVNAFKIGLCNDNYRFIGLNQHPTSRWSEENKTKKKRSCHSWLLNSTIYADERTGGSGLDKKNTFSKIFKEIKISTIKHIKYVYLPDTFDENDQRYNCEDDSSQNSSRYR